MPRILFVLFLIFIQCKSAQNTDTNETKAEERVFLEMTRTRCFGTCPAYEVRVYTSGKVEYKGEDFVPLKGEKTFNLSEEELKRIQKELDGLNFFELEDRYYKDVTDLPTTYISYYTPEKEKKVMDYYGAPAKLKQFEDVLQEIIFSYLE